MEIKNFYTFSSKLSSTTFQAYPVGLNGKEDNSGLFDEHKLIQGKYNSKDLPITFKQEQGLRLQDLLDTGWASLYLISDKMKNVLEENNLTGWETFAVNVFDKKGKEIRGYHGLSIKGKSGKINYNKSEIIEKRLVPNGPLFKYYKGLHVDLNQWDGKDFFLPEKYFGIMVTKRAALALKKSKLTNIRLENLAEIEIDHFTVQVALQNQE